MADLFSHIYTCLTRNIFAGCSWNIHTIFNRYIFGNIITYSPLLSTTIIYILCIALSLSNINTMLLRNFITFLRRFIMTNLLVMDPRANFLGCRSANSFVSDGALLPGNILTFFLRNLATNLFFNLPVLFLGHSLAYVRSFSSTFPLIRSGALAIVNSLTRRFNNCRAFLVVYGTTFPFVNGSTNPIFDCLTHGRILGGALPFIVGTTLTILLDPTNLISFVSTFTIILRMTLCIIHYFNISVINSVRNGFLNC